MSLLFFGIFSGARKPLLEGGELLVLGVVESRAQQAPADTVQVTGQVFIQTKGGNNVKLSLVPIALIPEDIVKKQLMDDKGKREKNQFKVYRNVKDKGIASTKTDADGKFTIAVPTTGKFAIAAEGSRTVPLEYYHWLVWVDPHATTIMLSNDNMMGEGSTESAFDELAKQEKEAKKKGGK